MNKKPQNNQEVPRGLVGWAGIINETWLKTRPKYVKLMKADGTYQEELRQVDEMARNIEEGMIDKEWKRCKEAGISFSLATNFEVRREVIMDTLINLPDVSKKALEEND